MKRLNRVAAFILIVAILLTPGAAFAATAPTISAQGAIVMDYDTGQVLYEKNADTPRSAASMTKVMTAYIVLDALRTGEATWDTVIPISDNARNQSPWDKTDFAETERLGDLFEPYLIRSNNQMGIAIGEYFGGGSEATFAERMNEKARLLGIDAYYTEANGLKPNRVTPRAQALLTRAIISDYPEILNTTSKHQTKYKSEIYRSTNQFYRKFRRFKGINGFKTGTASYSGQCLTATYTKKGRRLISVVMGSKGTDGRYHDTMALLNYAMSRYMTSPWAKDVPSRANHAGINTAAYRGLTSFQGREAMNRGEFTLLMGLALRLPMTEAGGGFSDVAADAYYAKAVAAAKNTGLIDGYEDGSFRPERLISREEMAKILFVAMKYDDSAKDLPFQDAAAIGPVFRPAVANLTARGILHGKDGNRFDPKGTASREEATLMMLNLKSQLN